VSAERPPDDDREITPGDPLRRDDDAEEVPAAPPPPWRRDPPADGPSPAQESWRPYPEDDDDTERRDPPADGPSPAQESWRPYPEDDDDTEPVARGAGEPDPGSPPDPEPRDVQRAFGTEPPPPVDAAFGEPERVEPAPAVPPPAPVEPAPPRAPGTSVGPPGYEEGATGGLTPGVTTAPPPPGRMGVPDPAARWVLASWGRRAAAFVIDGIVIGIVSALLIILITAAAGGVGFLGGDATGYGGVVVGLLFSMLVATAVALFYAPAYMARTQGQTLGKQLMGIRVVRAKGQEVDFVWSVLREVVVKTFLFAGILGSFTFGLAWLLDVLWPLWDDEHRALHDMLVDSRVVRA
jgi:uncharacterized RDD family membrane protein YckC